MNCTFQDCQKASARIYNPPNDSGAKRIFGTGFLVSSRYLLTCAHVVINALGLEAKNFLTVPNSPLPVDFPELDGTPENLARVIIWRPYPRFFEGLQHAPGNQDIALLRLEKPVQTTQPLSLHTSEASLNGHLFKIWGFPTGHDYGQATEGDIVAESARWSQLRVATNRPAIIGGYSGSPLWDKNLEIVVGMTVAAEEYDAKTGRGGRDAYAIAASQLAEIWLKQGQLIELLEGSSWLKSEQANIWMQKAFQHSSANYPNVIVPVNLGEIIQNLYELDEKTHQNLVDFVIFLLAHANFSNIEQNSLKTCLTNAYGITITDIEERIINTKNEASSVSLDIQSRLWLILNHATTPTHYQLESAYFIRDIEDYHEDDSKTYKSLKIEDHQAIETSELTTSLTDLLRNIVDQIPRERGSLSIEVFVPFKGLDKLNPDGWLIDGEFGEDPYSIGTDYPIIIRVLDRVDGYGKNYSRLTEWKRKWQHLQLSQSCKDSLICCKSPIENIMKALATDKAIGLHSDRPLAEQSNKPLPLIMREGVPIAFWCRRKLQSCQGQEMYNEALQSCLNELVNKLKALRNADPDNPSHLAHHLSLLWDDPSKTPPKLKRNPDYTATAAKI